MLFAEIAKMNVPTERERGREREKEREQKSGRDWQKKMSGLASMSIITDVSGIFAFCSAAAAAAAIPASIY